MKSVIITVLLAISALAQAPKPGTIVGNSGGGGGGGTGTVTSVVIAGTTNQITATGTCTITTTGTCTLSLPSGLVLPGTINGLTVTTTTGTITIAAAKVLTVSNSLTLAGTDGVTLTFPTTSATIARTDAGQTFTGNQTMTALLQAGSTAPTQTQADNSTKVATTAYVDAGLAGAGTVSGLTANFIPKASGPTSITADSILSDDGTTVGMGSPLVWGVLHTGGAYLSATADANGGSPNQCPVWYWGDNTCQTPAALIVNNDVTGDFSIVNNENDGVAIYSLYTGTGVSTGFASGGVISTYTSGTQAINIADLYLSILQRTPGVGNIINSSYDYAGTANVSSGELGGVRVQTNNFGSTGVLSNLFVYKGVGYTQGSGVGDQVENYYLYSGYFNLLGGSAQTTNAFGFYVGDMAGFSTNGYYSWFDSQGVRRIKEDNTFNAAGQAIEALYNPQFTKYTPGASNFERGVLGEWESNVFVINTEAGGTGVLRNIAIDGAEVDLGTSSHLVNIEAATFMWNGKTCTLVGTTPSCS